MKKATLRIIIIVLAATILFTGCSEEEEVLTMGFVPMRDGEQLIESLEPLEEMISREMGITVEAFTATNYVGVVEGLGSGQVDFGFIPPFAYALANGESDARVALTVLNASGESSYQSQFLVREDSDIESFEDLYGKTVAFVDPSSTSGYLFPGAHLYDQGIDMEEDISYLYSGGHDQSLQLLLSGDVDAAVTFVDARERYQEDFPNALVETRVLGHTEKIPNISVTISDSLDPETEEKLQEALIKIGDTKEGAELLAELFNIHGFVIAEDRDYDIIRDTAKIMNVDLSNQ
ncbi:phosphate/phosphite/phosphonate ABC transporter substrate-binding protein [Isachenkonia alkalipeptolytica]|uniref:Phosphate/phosphite/phosphonate ABC transporter substrate-binding protein n=1 Tax=Isachenkonia alkalipeptolytica TaxID=2565777 RepID=A0AA44BCU3_9CLOT|nr:phosphate/phosphite/phosphonate ABC transporter substrate-binding protein [Isachenkonia alkalipeptolytica]NBG87268.1 phosphate/phosphite/phosphonate ABC transporter substrate-binding protein [Isachenkonia alkalipeptolytica]